MKRLLLIILTASILLSLFACNNDEGKKGGDVTTGGYNPNGDIKIEAWATHLTDKQIANVRPQSKDVSTVYDLYMTKGETEGCQLVVYGNSKISMASLVSNAAAHRDKGITASAFVMNKAQTIGDKEWIDGAIPYSGTKFTLQKRTVVPFIVEFTTSADTPAGDYTFTCCGVPAV